MTDLAVLAQAACTAARAAGELLRSRPRDVHHKGTIDLVTEIDLASEACIREVLERLVPGVPVQGEEGGGRTDGSRWVVDPLDGTTNFVHGYPAYTVSIAYCEGPLPLAGAIYDPLTDRLTTAYVGGGTTVNDRRVSVSPTPRLIDALAVTGFPYGVRMDAAFYLTFVERVLRNAQGLRRSGSAAFDLATLACGQCDIFWEYGLKPWDTAAGAVLVREAGGVVSRVDGGAWAPGDETVLATNGHLHEAVVTLFRTGEGVG